MSVAKRAVTSQQLSTIASRALDWLWPRRCFGCQTTGAWLCPACRARLPRETSSPTTWIHASLPYGEPLIRCLIREFKYRGRSELGKIFVAIIRDDWLETLAEAGERFGPTEPWLVVPVPPSAGRQRERWFAPSELLAKHLAQTDPTNFRYVRGLKKIRVTAPQVKLARAQRLKNLRGAFKARRPTLICRQKIIVVDDVVTTGATLIEARRALLAAGATHVVGLTVAHG